MIDIRRRLLLLSRQEAERHYNPQTQLCLIPRETAWYAITLLESGSSSDLRLANTILSGLTVEDGTHSPCTLLAIYHRFHRVLNKSAVENILKNLHANLLISAAVRYTDGNVNHPVAAFVNLICSGELLRQPVYTAMGKQNLQAFHRLITSRRHQRHQQAEMAEYNSPTYTALTLWFLALAAERAQDAEARELAQALEQGLWINLGMHWHEPSQQWAGPFSRAYAEDSYGGYSALHCTAACALNRTLFFEPRLARQFNHPSALIQNALPAILQFHVPQQAQALFFHKPWPYQFRITTYCEAYHENGVRPLDQGMVACFDDEIYPGGWSDLTTYLTAEYCLATASRPYVNAGQSDGFTLRWRRAAEVKRLADFRSLYTRMVFNESTVGRDNLCHVIGATVARDYLYEEGRCFTCQHENTAVVCYAAKRAGHKNFSALRLDLIFTFQAPFDEFFLDGLPVNRFPYDGRRVEKIVIADFNIYLALLPLSASMPVGFSGLTRIRQDADHLILSLYNYQGPAVSFERERMSLIHNGFACVVETRSRFAHTRDFLQYIDSAHLEEQEVESGRRSIRFTVGADTMDFQLNPFNEQILAQRWNGEEEPLFHFDIRADRAAGADYFPSALYLKPTHTQ
ncbi:hypothetical protein GX408_06975 [bacterium]|nr:hypothetical protein [bacterium]